MPNAQTVRLQSPVHVRAMGVVGVRWLGLLCVGVALQACVTESLPGDGGPEEAGGDQGSEVDGGAEDAEMLDDGAGGDDLRGDSGCPIWIRFRKRFVSASDEVWELPASGRFPRIYQDNPLEPQSEPVRVQSEPLEGREICVFGNPQLRTFAQSISSLSFIGNELEVVSLYTASTAPGRTGLQSQYSFVELAVAETPPLQAQDVFLLRSPSVAVFNDYGREELMPNTEVGTTSLLASVGNLLGPVRPQPLDAFQLMLFRSREERGMYRGEVVSATEWRLPYANTTTLTSISFSKLTAVPTQRFNGTADPTSVRIEMLRASRADAQVLSSYEFGGSPTSTTYPSLRQPWLLLSSSTVAAPPLSEIEVPVVDTRPMLVRVLAAARADAAIAVAFQMLGANTRTAPPGLRPVESVRIAGRSAELPLTGVGLTPTISWLPPSAPGALGYRVRVAEAGGETYLATTRETSLRLPPEVLRRGGRYTLSIEAYDGPLMGDREVVVQVGFSQNQSGYLSNVFAP